MKGLQSVDVLHACGHRTKDFAYDCFTAHLVAKLRQQPCLDCQPMIEIVRACSHRTMIERRLDMTAQEITALSAMLCQPCDWAARPGLIIDVPVPPVVD